MSKDIIRTPFSEYREEQLKTQLFDYFVHPDFFDIFSDSKPQLIYGSRGTGKTTLLKALALSNAVNEKEYLENKSYIGVYYRIDLNITAAFKSIGVNEDQRNKLFTFYFVLAINYELVSRIIDIRGHFEIEHEESFVKKYDLLLCGEESAKTLEDLKSALFRQLYMIRDYINNCGYQPFPHIGDYGSTMQDISKDLLSSINKDYLHEKTIFYLVDEFEGLDEWQQKQIISLIKYSDHSHTFKVCMRPDGLKTDKTIGGEYISETDDVSSINLNELLLQDWERFYRYAQDVCEKRYRLYCKKHDLEIDDNFQIETLFERIDDKKEYDYICAERNNVIRDEIEAFCSNYGENFTEMLKRFENDYPSFLTFKLFCKKNEKKYDFEKIKTLYLNNTKQVRGFRQNYKIAIKYYMYNHFSKRKRYSGFEDMVRISGGTIRYLLEICNEVFELAILENEFTFENPQIISFSIQSKAIENVSKKRTEQIGSIPEIGVSIRMFVDSVGRIFQLYHGEERLSKIEPNHFSIKADSDVLGESLETFLRTCVMRGVFLKQRNNKQKNRGLGYDDFLYILHPIYTPNYNISWRRKQKIEFSTEELKILVDGGARARDRYINDVAKKCKVKSKGIEDCQLRFGI